MGKACNTAPESGHYDCCSPCSGSDSCSDPDFGDSEEE